MEEAGWPMVGGLSNPLGAVDVVVDCAPNNIAAGNLTLHHEHGVKSVFTGSTEHALTGDPFVAHANHDSTKGRDTTRVISCNTTVTVRTFTTLREPGLPPRARGVLDIRGDLVGP